MSELIISGSTESFSLGEMFPATSSEGTDLFYIVKTINGEFISYAISQSTFVNSIINQIITGSFVQSVSGPIVDDTDPFNPIINGINEENVINTTRSYIKGQQTQELPLVIATNSITPNLSDGNSLR